jgi:CRP-like cAMP-binding protein
MLGMPGLHSWIRQLPEPARTDVLAAMRPREVTEGASVYTLGSPPNECYMIDSGRVRVCNFSDTGKEVCMGELFSGDCIAELGMIDGLPRFNNAFAAEDSVVLVLKKADFDRLYEQHVVIARQLNLFLAHRVRYLYVSAEDARALSLNQRLARMLSRMGWGSGVRGENGEILIASVSHETLGHMLGATRQAVSREMKILEKAGLVRVSYSRVYIPDIKALVSKFENLLGGENIVPDYRD